ncbi:hypothetical protein JGU66_21465 [Myxococcaceae bacterium JPH2]|nr:hypothetical protein [Myxococcaceae bacterium JPH2]
MTMGRAAIGLLLVCGAVGCGHSRLPSLPATHGQLSMAMEKYSVHWREDAHSSAIGDPPVEVEPAQAESLFIEAKRTLEGSPSDDQVQGAWADLRAACFAQLDAACEYIADNFQRPRSIDGAKKWAPKLDSAQAGMLYWAVVVCRVGLDGHLKKCSVIEHGGTVALAAVLDFTGQVRTLPATISGHPFETSLVTKFTLMPGSEPLTPAQTLQWLRERTARFPGSFAAWADLAELLSGQYPEAPEYLDALRQLNHLVPDYWWASNELAWQLIQDGRFEAALQLARHAMPRAIRNPYVRETLAAALAGMGQCDAALNEQRRAVRALPSEWPLPERKRFLTTLRSYQEKCGAPAASPQPGTAAPKQ